MSRRNRLIITVANQKGGVGKTTTAAHLAHGLALAGLQTLALDLDPQGNLATILGRPGGAGIHDWLVTNARLQDLVDHGGRPGLALLPGDKSTALASTYLNAAYQGALPLDLLAAKLRPAFTNGLQAVVIDTAPSVSALQAIALYAADLVLIPASCDALAEHGVRATLDTLDLLAQYGALQAALLPTRYDARTTASQTSLDHYIEALAGEIPVLPVIHEAAALKHAAAFGRTIYEHAPGTRPDREYQALVDQVLEWKGARP